MRDAHTWAEASEILALGDHHRSLLRPLFAGEEEVYPRFAVEAYGCRLVDERGRTFIDWVSGAGCALLGYRHPAVEAAIREQLAAGPMLSLYHPIEVELARALTQLIPCAEMVGFGKSASDVLTAAVRIARAHTGRKLILYHGYHGFHDWFACRQQLRPGLPHASSENLRNFPYNDLPALEALLERFRGSVAAILMEPTSMTPPAPGYLEGVRELASAHGVLLIFDEVWTWYRLAPGGAQELYGVLPDLACYGKSLGNGMPLAAVVGSRRYMRLLPSVVFGMTHRDETLSLAAAHAVLGVVRAEPVVNRIQSVGRRIRAELLALSEKAGIRCAVVGMDARLKIEFDDQGGARREYLLQLFTRECAARGVLTSGLIGANYGHDEAAVRQTLEAFAAGIGLVARVVQRAPNVSLAEATAPSPLLRAEGHLDRVEVLSDGQLAIEGWLLIDDACATRIEVVATDGHVLVAEVCARPDVLAAFHLPADALSCGLAAALPPAIFAREGDWEFELRARVADATVFRCAITYRTGWTRPVLSDTAWLTFGV